MYWSDWASKPRIERSAMDGTKRVAIVATVGKANGLTVDYQLKKLFWIDLDLLIIESSNFDGTKRRKILGDGALRQPYGFDLYQVSVDPFRVVSRVLFLVH